jgi:hypothetical protein
LPHRREVVVGGQRLPDLDRADVQRRHAVGLQPGAQREGAAAQDVRLLHAGHRRQPRLHHADEVVGDLVLLEDLRIEAEVHRRERGVGRLEGDGRDLGLGGQIPTNLVHAGADVGQRAGGVDVQLEADVDGREPLVALRLDVVDAVGGGHRTLDGRGDEPAHQIGAGAHVGRADGDGGALQARVLANVEAADGLKAGDDDDEVDHHGQHGPADEQVREAHVTGSPAAASGTAST